MGAASLITSVQKEVGLDELGAELSPQTLVSAYKMQRVADSTSLRDTATQDSTSSHAEKGSKSEHQELTLPV